MRVLVFAHSGGAGGAEHALRHLVGLLRERHEVELVLPSVDGGEAAYYQSLGLHCHLLKSPLSLPNVSSALLNYALMDLQGVAKVLAERRFDVAISNTMAALHGALVAQMLGIAHLCYVHESLGDGGTAHDGHDPDHDLAPGALTSASYLDLVQDSSAAILSCADGVARQFPAHKLARMKVLEPYDYALAPVVRHIDPQAERVVQVIGTQSLRKNPQFAVTVVKALALRGWRVRLDIMGSRNSASTKLQRAIDKRQVPVRLLDHVADPYAVNAAAQVVTLICAHTEPYGLTIPESLRRGVPVVSTRSGGPEGLLPPDYLFPVDDLDACVRILERIFKAYDREARNAEVLYDYLAHRHTRADLLDALDGTLTALQRARPAAPTMRLASLVQRMVSVAHPPIGLDTVAEHIAAVAIEQGLDWPVQTVLDKIAQDAQQPGAAVMEDLRRFDVVPYAMSAQMDELYKHGLGLAIELASTWGDAARVHMAAYIFTTLDELRVRLGRSPRILALGDGIGLDSLRLAASGFDVSYMDYDGSNMAKIAKKNFELASRRPEGRVDVTVLELVTEPFDAIVCLEVIEHVPDPAAFGHIIADYLVPGGTLFISDCFNGVEDRWPTHLLSNEAHAGTLPMMLSTDFEFVTAHKVPFGKPFVLRKRVMPSAGGGERALAHRHVLSNFISSQLDIGI